jgi:hypothetical protein
MVILRYLRHHDQKQTQGNTPVVGGVLDSKKGFAEGVNRRHLCDSGSLVILGWTRLQLAEPSQLQ